MFSSDNIIFNNQMHEIDDVGANELNEIFETWFYNFVPKYCQCLISQVFVMLWHHGVTDKGSWM